MQATLIVAALLHPDVAPQAVQPYRTGSCTIKILESLQATDHLDAALVFGGDGTVHRHLSELYKQQIPVLVVPKGSGNDFAKSLGIASEKTALRAWKDFCAS